MNDAFFCYFGCEYWCLVNALIISVYGIIVPAVRNKK